MLASHQAVSSGPIISVGEPSKVSSSFGTSRSSPGRRRRPRRGRPRRRARRRSASPAATRAAAAGSPASGTARRRRRSPRRCSAVSVVACSASVMKMFSSRIVPLADPRRAEALEARPRDGRVVVPRERPDDRLEERDPADPLGVAGRPVERERAAPVMADEDHVLELQRVEPGVEVARVVGEAVGDVGLARAAHPDQVGGEAAGRREHVAPHVRRGRVAVQVDERTVGPFVVDRRVEDVDAGHGAAFRW